MSHCCQNWRKKWDDRSLEIKDDIYFISALAENLRTVTDIFTDESRLSDHTLTTFGRPRIGYNLNKRRRPWYLIDIPQSSSMINCYPVLKNLPQLMTTPIEVTTPVEILQSVIERRMLRKSANLTWVDFHKNVKPA